MSIHKKSYSSEGCDGPECSGPFSSDTCSGDTCLYTKVLHKATCWLEIDKARFFKNVESLKKLIGPTVAVAAVLKSNAYGHGLCEIGSLCQEHESFSGCAVFLLSDAIKLRSSGFRKSILILGGYDCAIEEAINNDVDCVVYDWALVNEIIACAQKCKKQARVQIKVDTGLARLGFAPEEVPHVAQHLLKSKCVTITGMYSHFAESDSVDTSFTYKQIQKFNNVYAALQSMKIEMSCVHIANTAASLRFPEARFSMVRCGGALYGSYKDECFYGDAQEIVPDFSLQTVLTFKSRIIAVRKISVGMPVGYGCSFKAKHSMCLAIVSVGYYDGYDRRLSNTGRMVIRGKKVSVVGRVGMNMTVIDVTDVPGVVVGDEVIVVGDYDGVRLKDIACQMNVIEYEVMPSLNPAIKRIIV